MFKPRTYNIISGSLQYSGKETSAGRKGRKGKLVTIALASTLSPSPELQDCFQAFPNLKRQVLGGRPMAVIVLEKT